MQDLFMEMISMGDFYDRDGDGTVENDEKLVKYALTRRTRGRKSIVRVTFGRHAFRGQAPARKSKR